MRASSSLSSEEHGEVDGCSGFRAGDADSTPVVLTVDVGGSALQSLLNALGMGGKDVHVLCLATRRVPGTLRTSGLLLLPLLAHAQWGGQGLCTMLPF